MNANVDSRLGLKQCAALYFSMVAFGMSVASWLLTVSLAGLLSGNSGSIGSLRPPAVVAILFMFLSIGTMIDWIRSNKPRQAMHEAARLRRLAGLVFPPVFLVYLFIIGGAWAVAKLRARVQSSIAR